MNPIVINLAKISLSLIETNNTNHLEIDRDRPKRPFSSKDTF
jgi:hypothetical protein